MVSPSIFLKVMTFDNLFYRDACIRGATRKLSVCPSVKRVDCDKTEERSVQIFYTLQKI